MNALGANEVLFDQLNSRRVPALPAGAIHLLNSLTDENIGFRELATIIEHHPIIAGRLIALANSAWSCPQDTVDSLDMVCARLGIGVVRSTSIALAVASPFDPRRCPGFDVSRFWTCALMTADVSSRLVSLASSVNNLEPSTARTAGLLHSIGLLWLADQLPNEVSRAIEYNESEGHPNLASALQDTIGIDASQAGDFLASAWKLPETLVAAIAHCHEQEYNGRHWETACVVGAAVTIVSAVHAQDPCLGVDAFFDRLGIDSTQFQKVFDQVEQQVERTSLLARTLFVG